jgi:hypothetical protein
VTHSRPQTDRSTTGAWPLHAPGSTKGRGKRRSLRGSRCRWRVP